MKKILLSLFILSGLSGYSQNITIPDKIFLDALIEKEVDTDKDGAISKSEAESVVELNFYDKGISDITGINNFTNLTSLNFVKTNIQYADVSGLKKLTSFAITESKLEEIDLSENVLLEHISFQANQLKCIDVSMLPKLKLAYLNGNFQLAGTVNFSQNPNLIVCQVASCPDVIKICITNMSNVLNDRGGNWVKSPNTFWSEACSKEEGGCPLITNVKADLAENGKNMFNVYPTNFTESFNVKLTENSVHEILIYSLDGSLKGHQTTAGSGELTLGENLVSGTYLVKIVKGETIKTFKINKI